MKWKIILGILIGGLIVLTVSYFVEPPTKKIIFQEEITATSESLPIQKQEFAEETSKPLKVTLSNNLLEQGETLIITAENLKSNQIITGKFDDKIFDFFPVKDNKYIGVVGIDVKKKPGDYSLIVTISGENPIKKTITVKKADFNITELALNQELKEKNYTPSNIVENIITTDGVLIWEVLKKYTSKPYFNKPFVYPLDSVVDVGAFGNIRKSGDVSLQHLGVDLDALENTPIYAINDGIVRFVKPLTVYGNTVIIDHGLGIYSLYLHLNEFQVKEGDKVKRGQIIGLVGNTGYSLGPHLHLSIKVNEASINPLKFIEIVNKNLES